jgi:hypothetical protein
MYYSFKFTTIFRKHRRLTKTEYKQNKFSELYQIERNKLTILPDADADFKALENTYKNYDIYSNSNNSCNDWWR